MRLTRKEDRKSARVFIIENGLAKDVPGHSLVLTTKGNELLTSLINAKLIEFEHKDKRARLGQKRNIRVR